MSQASKHLATIRSLSIPTLCRNIHTLCDLVLRERPGAICVDIGANVGGYVGYCLDRGAAQVHAFEPVPWNFEQLRATWGHEPRAFLRELAIGDTPATHRGARVWNTHTLATADELAHRLDIASDEAHDRGPFDFDTITLDGYVKAHEIARVDFIKLDVDGYEPAALRGMAHVLRTFRPAVMIELSYLPRALGESCDAMIEGIYRAGYWICTMAGEVIEDPISIMEAYPWRTSFDMVMMPRERVPGEWPRIA